MYYKYEVLEKLCKKVVSKPFYTLNDYTGEIIKVNYSGDYKVLYNFEKKRIEIYYYEIMAFYYIDDYCKTWAFTMKELGGKKNDN